MVGSVALGRATLPVLSLLFSCPNYRRVAHNSGFTLCSKLQSSYFSTSPLQSVPWPSLCHAKLKLLPPIFEFRPLSSTYGDFFFSPSSNIRCTTPAEFFPVILYRTSYGSDTQIIPFSCNPIGWFFLSYPPSSCFRGASHSPTYVYLFSGEPRPLPLWLKMILGSD